MLSLVREEREERKNPRYFVFSFFASFALFADNIVFICVYLRLSVDMAFMNTYDCSTHNYCFIYFREESRLIRVSSPVTAIHAETPLQQYLPGPEGIYRLI